jgi:hypothetical protein
VPSAGNLKKSGILEYWSNGVVEKEKNGIMKEKKNGVLGRLIKIRVLVAFFHDSNTPNTPVLQYSSTPIFQHSSITFFH